MITMKVLNLDEGKLLVSAARESIKEYQKNKNFDKTLIISKLKSPELNSKFGIFVTLYSHKDNELKGCVGFPRPIEKLKDSIVDAALSAAFEDYRFSNIKRDELDHIVIEVSILSEMKQLKGNPNSFPDQIKIGEDGLLIEYGVYNGLLLPIVAVEQKFNSEEFLKETCLKAGVCEDCWNKPEAKVYKFQTQIFKEESPNGEVKEINL